MDISEIEKNIGVTFANAVLLENALIHRSYLNENEELNIESNERMEFLGDAILQFISSEHLYKEYPEFTEGELTNLRSKIVNTESLAEETRRLNLIDHLLISNGERETAYESRSIQADVFEAVLGAIYLDSDIEACRTFLVNQLFHKVDKIIDSGELKDPKSLFQEIAQEKQGVTPIYKVIQDSGPDHNKTFKIGAYIGDKLIAKGEGSSKRKAQQSAANQALKKYNKKS